MTLDPKTLRQSPQLAALSVLDEAAHTAILAILAAHPAIEHVLTQDPQDPLERLADHVVDHLMLTLDALDHYRRLLHDRQRLHQALSNDEDDLTFCF
jgi:hypothetical protein